jgi:hypothetical protein
VASRNWPVLIVAGFIAVLFHSRASFAQPADAPPPFTSLFDTATPSATPLPPEALNTRKGWTAIPEDTLAHTFTGDAVFMNDRVAVAIRRNAAGSEVYSRLPGGSKQRVELLPLGLDGATGTLSGLKIIENSQASVLLEATLSGKGGAAAVFRFRLTAGESLLEVRGGAGAGRLRVCDQSQYVVVPDFFADDMVFDPAAHENMRIGLPAENTVLGQADNGAAIVACIWPSSRQTVDLLLSPKGPPRTITGYEIDLPANGKLWVAAMEGAGIWHARRVTDQKASTDLALEWKRPMPARWRADFVGGDGRSISTYFADPEAGAEPENAKSNGACRFDAGRALVRVIDPVAAASPGLVVVYPVERTRTTPLTSFCLVDLMRNALGVGPCQYVLDAEGLGNSESPTPDQVTHWVEKQIEKKVSKRDVDTIREQLAKMALQVKSTDARIGEYIVFAAKVNQVCAESAKDPGQSTDFTRLADIAKRMTAPPAATHPEVEKLAGEVAAQAEREDALAKCQATLAAIRTAGAAQDYALAKLRMAARRLKQEARTLAAADPKSGALATKIQKLAEEMLVRK